MMASFSQMILQMKKVGRSVCVERGEDLGEVLHKASNGAQAAGMHKSFFLNKFFWWEVS